MFFPSSKRVCRKLARQASTNIKATCQSGFTLIELLVVIGLLAIIAGIAIVSYEGVQDQGRDDITRYEMTEIRKALLQFRRDSGSHDFPRQGSYACTDEFNPGGSDTVANSQMVFPAEAGTTNSQKITWCKHPANFWMLFSDPLNKGWNADTKRGWNGPYLQRKSGYLDIGDNLDTSGLGQPYAGAIVSKVWGIASPFIVKPNGNYLVWSNMADQLTVGYEEYSQYGSPYFLFDLDDDNNADSEARLVSMGADNVYDAIDAPNCEQVLDNEGNPVDYILCLLR